MGLEAAAAAASVASAAAAAAAAAAAVARPSADPPWNAAPRLAMPPLPPVRRNVEGAAAAAAVAVASANDARCQAVACAVQDKVGGAAT